MTKDTRRSIENRLEDLDTETPDDGGILFVYETDGEEYVDADGDPIPEERLNQAGLIFNFTTPE